MLQVVQVLIDFLPWISLLLLGELVVRWIHEYCDTMCTPLALMSCARIVVSVLIAENFTAVVVCTHPRVTFYIHLFKP